MALINCPECNSEISSLCVSCPRCGFPIAPDTEQNQEVQAVEITGVRLDKKVNVKRIMIIALCAAAVLIAVVFGFRQIQKTRLKEAQSTYLGDLRELHYTMLIGAASAEEIGNLTRDVWYNVIYKKASSETDPYTKTGHVFHSDFNTALQLLASSDTASSIKNEIKASQLAAEELYRDLQEPPQGLEKHYELMEATFDAYTRFTNFALKATGSLQSFTADLRKYDTAYIEEYEKLDRLLSG